MSEATKLIVISHHANLRAKERGASEEEIREVLYRGSWEPAKRGKQQARWNFVCNVKSPVGGKYYTEKTVEVVFAEEPDKLIVVTVKVFYTGREE